MSTPMKAIAVRPGQARSLHLTTLPRPSLDDVPGGRGVLVRVLRVGLDGTDKEIDAAEYGTAPPGSDVLVVGHESFGVVEAVGAAVTELAPGDFVVATVRRRGTSPYDQIGAYDMTTDETYFERGISLRHGFLTEYYVDDPEYIVRVPGGLREVGVLLEPVSVVEKGLAQAWEVQRRLRIWQPRRAAVYGAGTIGLLATLLLRLRGLEVTTFGLAQERHLNSDLVEALGATYASTRDVPVRETGERFGPFDIAFECTGAAAVAFDAMLALAKNGVLVLSSITGGHETLQVPAAQINQALVLGNRVVVGTVNGNREYFESGVQHMAQAEMQYPGWLGRLLTHRVEGLDVEAIVQALYHGTSVIKVYCEVSQ